MRWWWFESKSKRSRSTL